MGGGRQGSKPERAVTGCRRALFGMDPKHADGKLYMILQLSKVLQGEPEKVGGAGYLGLGYLCPASRALHILAHQKNRKYVGFVLQGIEQV